MEFGRQWWRQEATQAFAVDVVDRGGGDVRELFRSLVIDLLLEGRKKAVPDLAICIDKHAIHQNRELWKIRFGEEILIFEWNLIFY